MYYFSSFVSTVREKEIVDILELPTTGAEPAHHLAQWQIVGVQYTV